MEIQLLHYLVAYTAIITVYLIDRQAKTPSVRDYSVLALEISNQVIYFSLAYFMLEKIVDLINPLEIMSVSNLDVPIYINMMLSLLLIDFFHYINHRLHHSINFLWKLHRLHHSDQKVDPLTTFLHHPIEAITSYFILISCYVIFDIPVPVLIGYAFLQAIHAPFTHMRNLLNDRINSTLNLVFVSPNFHRIHHSLDFNQSNSNYGLIFTFWDRIFRTYTKVTQKKLVLMPLGITKEQSPKSESFPQYLINPFKK